MNLGYIDVFPIRILGDDLPMDIRVPVVGLIRVGKRLENRPFLVGSDDMNGVFKILVVFRRDTIRLIFPSTSSA